MSKDLSNTINQFRPWWDLFHQGSFKISLVGPIYTLFHKNKVYTNVQIKIVNKTKNIWKIQKLLVLKLSKSNVTQLNSTQSNFKATSVGVRHQLGSQVTHHPPHTTNISGTSRPARELKFGTHTRYTKLIKITWLALHN